MNDFAHRLALALLVAAGGGSLVGGLLAARAASLEGQHQQLMLAMLAGALALSAWLPALRMPALVATLLANASYLALNTVHGSGPAWPLVAWGQSALLLALCVAGAILLWESRREARWDGRRVLRQEG